MATQKRNRNNAGSNIKGKEWMFGGVLILDQRGELRHVLLEVIDGEQFDPYKLDRVVAQIRQLDPTDGLSSFLLSSSDPDRGVLATRKQPCNVSLLVSTFCWLCRLSVGYDKHGFTF
jgi:hypothetical protein